MVDVTLTLVCHAPTPATRRAAFPLDEPLDAQGHAAAVVAGGDTGRVDACWTGPSLRARQTAEAMGQEAVPDPLLRDLDCGAWSGRTLADVAAADPTGLTAWLSDPAARPHGGETIEELQERARAWLEGLSGPAQRVAAVTHAAVIRAAVLVALGTPSAAFWRIDVMPLARVRIRGRKGRWTLQLR